MLNSAGGEEKVSPDGGLRQSSTLSDNVVFKFYSGEECEVTTPSPNSVFCEAFERYMLHTGLLLAGPTNQYVLNPPTPPHTAATRCQGRISSLQSEGFCHSFRVSHHKR